MPYIKESRKQEISAFGGCLRDSSAGDINYLFTQLCQQYLKIKGECYQTYNDLMGALEGAKLELYRRKIAPYEDKKIQENGDVY